MDHGNEVVQTNNDFAIRNQTNDEALVFLHLPKTGGRSLVEVINANIPRAKIFPYVEWNKIVDNISKQKDYYHFRGHLFYEIGNIINRPVKYITMMRNPIDRIVSQYRFICRTPDHKRYNKVKDMSFREFISEKGNHRCYIRFLTYVPRQTGSLPYSDEMIPQKNRRSAVELAKERLDGFEFVGITEKFSESLDVFSGRFGWPKPGILPRNNASPDYDRIELTSSDIRLIQEYSADDIEIYDYACRLLEDSVSKLS
ncbi:MAG: sulfotransferase family 2 domain-containing protein [Sulfitobacter sp.]|uniref:sulfotransferase family 2 domain-containing protein n=1 Tax=Alphaproteobacteria TaxID=28211 RepID=UPI003273AEF7